MKKRVMYFLINDQFTYQKIIKKSLFRLKLAQKLSFFLNFNNDFYNYFVKFVKKTFLKAPSQYHAKKKKKNAFFRRHQS
jgi:hypothetical protein